MLIHHPEDQPDPSTKGFAGIIYRARLKVGCTVSCVNVSTPRANEAIAITPEKKYFIKGLLFFFYLCYIVHYTRFWDLKKDKKELDGVK